MIDEGTVTAQYNGRFESLFSDYATEVMDTLPSSGTPLQKEAAQRYAALQRLVNARLNQAATALVTRL